MGKDEESLEKLQQARTDQKYGLALGFPKTAVETFNDTESSTSLTRTELPEDIKKSDAFKFIQIKLSKNNWQEEIKTVQRWAEVIKKNSPKLFKEIVEDPRDIVEAELWN